MMMTVFCGGALADVTLEEAKSIALERAGATVCGEDGQSPAPITKADLYARGLSGREGSAQRRKELLHSLELPERLSADAMLDVLNALMTREDFYRLDC